VTHLAALSLDCSPGCIAQCMQRHKRRAMQMVSAQSMKARGAAAGVWDHRTGVTITGYSALFCFSALCTTLLLGARYAWARWRGGRSDQYQRVVKHGDV
jgi:hypothetical protein